MSFARSLVCGLLNDSDEGDRFCSVDCGSVLGLLCLLPWEVSWIPTLVEWVQFSSHRHVCSLQGILPRHLLADRQICLNLGSRYLGRHRRNVPPPGPLIFRLVRNRRKLVLELSAYILHSLHHLGHPIPLRLRFRGMQSPCGDRSVLLLL